jgi:hypothetical protein
MQILNERSPSLSLERRWEEMLGFLIGTVCLIGLLKLLRANRCERFHGGCGGSRRARGFRRSGRGFWLRGLFERLDTSPGQEKVIKQSTEELFEATRGLRTELDHSRHELASAFRSGVIDETSMGEMFARHDEKLREFRTTVVGALVKINDALDEEQRRELADLLERGLGKGMFRGGPYRGDGRGQHVA